MSNDAAKSTMMGLLLFGASLLGGQSAWATLVGGVGVNWASEGAQSLWQTLSASRDTTQPMEKALTRALRKTVDHLYSEYERLYGRPEPQNAFDSVKACAASLARLPNDQPLHQSELMAALQTELRGVLHGFPDREVHYLEKELLPRVAVAFFAEICDDTDAQAVFQQMLLRAVHQIVTDLPAQFQAIHDLSQRTLRADIERDLQKVLDELRAEFRRQQSPLGLDLSNMDISQTSVALEGGEAHVTNENSASPPANPSAHRPIAHQSAIAVGKGSRATTTNRAGTIDPLPPEIPQAIHLSVRFALHTDGKVTVLWQSAECGSARSVFAMPFQGMDLAAVLRGLEGLQHPDFHVSLADKARLTQLGLPDPSGAERADLAKRIGTMLHAALFCDQVVIYYWARLTQQAQMTKRPIHIQFTFTPDSIELAALPWELLWAQTRQHPLLMDSPEPIWLTRSLESGTTPTPRAPRGQRPLRILALTPQEQRDPQSAAQIRRELDSLWEHVRTQHASVVEEPSLIASSDLISAVERSEPDVVQFTGHGWYATGRGVIFLDRSANGSSLLDAHLVAQALRDVPMVILTACRGAQSSGIEAGEASLLSGVAPALSASGVPIVIGMQLGITVSAAIQICRHIYDALHQHQSIYAAVARARRELFIAQSPAWYVPALFVNGPIDGKP